MCQGRTGQGMRREIGYDVFASDDPHEQAMPFPNMGHNPLIPILGRCRNRSEEHTSELQSLMRISYDVFCLKNKIITRYIDSYSYNNKQIIRNLSNINIQNRDVL